LSESDPASVIPVEDETSLPVVKPRFSKRAVVIASGVVALLLLAAGAAFFLLRPAPGTASSAQAKADTHAEEAATYIDAPAMVVNLRGADGTARFLKIRFTFVPTSEAAGAKIKAKLPLIVDAFQPFLRELRPEDLAGSAAVFRIKEEMLVRATDAMGPGVVRDILIQDLIQQ
jgi:flagellar FliL protein